MPEIVAVLRAHRDEQLIQKLTVGDEWDDHDFVFCQWNGRPVDPRTDWREWTDILKLAGIEHVGVHGARHSAATMMLERGVDISVVQELLGHCPSRS